MPTPNEPPNVIELRQLVEDKGHDHRPKPGDLWWHPSLTIGEQLERHSQRTEPMPPSEVSDADTQ